MLYQYNTKLLCSIFTLRPVLICTVHPDVFVLYDPTPVGRWILCTDIFILDLSTCPFVKTEDFRSETFPDILRLLIYNLPLVKIHI